MENRRLIVLTAAIVGLAGASLFYCHSGTPGGSSSVYVLHAGSLTRPLERIDEINESLQVKNEPHGSVTVSRLVSEGLKKPDVAAVSDYSLIPDFMMSEGLTDWYIQFARNEVVLCYRKIASTPVR